MGFLLFFCLYFTTFAIGKSNLTLKVAWFKWDPCDNLAKVSQDYPNAIIDVECIDFPDWYDRSFNTNNSSNNHFDVLVLDSQWTGQAVSTGFVLDLTDVVESHEFLKGDFFDNALKYYGQYPPSSGKFYALPFQADVQMLVYRKDLFRQHKQALPFSIEDMLKVAVFFHSNASANVEYGYSSFWCLGEDKCVDETPTLWHQFAWMFGGRLWNESSYRIAGVLDSQENQKSLDYLKKLFDTGGQRAGSFGGAVSDFCSGKSAMLQIWMGFAPTFLDLKTCNTTAGGFNLSDIGFYSVPFSEQTNLHKLSLGGMGLYVASKSNHSEAAKSYIKWLTSRPTMQKWSDMGGFTVRKSVAANPGFLVNKESKLIPYQQVFLLSYPLVQDFWNLPVWRSLLMTENKYLSLFLAGNMSAEQTLKTMAVQQQAIVDREFPCGRVCPVYFQRSAALFAVLPAAGVVASLLLCVSLYLTVRYKLNKVIRAANAKFLLSMQCGGLLMLTSMTITAAQPTDALCLAQTVLEHVGYAIELSALLIKAYLVARVFRNTTLQVTTFKYANSLKAQAVVVLPVGLYLLVWNLVDPVKAKTTTTNTGELVVECGSLSQKYHTGMFVGETFLLLLGVGITVTLKSVPTLFHEARWINYAIYNSMIFGGLVEFMNLLDPSLNVLYFLRMMNILVVALGTCGFVLLPKFLSIWGFLDLELKDLNGDVVSTKSVVSMSTLSSASATPRASSTQMSNLGAKNKNSTSGLSSVADI